MIIDLPANFTGNIKKIFGSRGIDWLEQLPALIKKASDLWGLEDVQPVSNLSHNFVAYACRPSTAPRKPRGFALGDVVLKIGVPCRELSSEIAALKAFDGNGMCRLLECDEERGLLLLEKLIPGTILSELENDDERTQTAVDVMQNVWASSSHIHSGGNFIKLSDWFDGLKEIRPHFGGGTGVFPKKLLERVESFLPELFAVKDIRLLHGDFHHFNVLRSERGWLAIDPKGVIGPVGYEIGPLMLNPWNSFSDRNQFKAQAERRVSILSERLGWERESILKWATAHAVLSAWWDFDENGKDWKYSLNCAGDFSQIK